MPKVSVIIPTYNRADMLEGAVESVLAQTYRDYEIIVVDDGSTDGIQEVFGRFEAHKHIRCFSQANAGSAAARNLGIRHARGEYLAFLDSDDRFLPGKLEKQAAFLDTHPKIALVHSYFIKVDLQGRSQGLRKPASFQGAIYPQLLLEWGTLIHPSCVMMRREAVNALGGFDTDIHYCEDLELWARAARGHTFGLIPEALALVCVHPGNMSSDVLKMDEHFRKYLEIVFQKDPGLTPRFKRRALARMYARVALNGLGSGSRVDMRVVREKARTALHHWPLSLGAYGAVMFSWVSFPIRKWLHRIWHKVRFRAGEY